MSRPEVVNIGNDIILLIFDSQWWLHPYDKPGIESDCDCKTEIEVVSKIREIATKNTDKLIIVADHHPFKSNGVHGGFLLSNNISFRLLISNEVFMFRYLS